MMTAGSFFSPLGQSLQVFAAIKAAEDLLSFAWHSDFISVIKVRMSRDKIVMQVTIAACWA